MPRAPVAAHGDEDLFGFLDLRLSVGVGIGDLDAGFGLLDLFDFGACVDVDAALFEEARQFFRDLLVFDGDDAG
jgi:hypothetical protein